MIQQVQKKGSKKDLTYSIFLKIQEGLTTRELCDFFKLNIKALSYHLCKLKASGSIEKLGYSVYKAKVFNENKSKKIKLTKGGTLDDPFDKSKKNRGHAFQWTIKIPRLLNWSKREQFLNKHDIKFKLVNKGHTHSIVFRDHIVWLNQHSIVIWTPKSLSFFSDSAKGSEEVAFQHMLSIMTGLENLLKVSFRTGKSYFFKVSRRHHANVSNALARDLNNKKLKLNVKNVDGLWFSIDDSFNLDEAETVGNHGRNDAQKDMDNLIVPFFNSLKEQPFTAYDFRNLFTAVNGLASASKMAHEQMLFLQENNKTHFAVLSGIQRAIEKLEKRLEDEKGDKKG